MKIVSTKSGSGQIDSLSSEKISENNSIILGSRYSDLKREQLGLKWESSKLKIFLEHERIGRTKDEKKMIICKNY